VSQQGTAAQKALEWVVLQPHLGLAVVEGAGVRGIPPAVAPRLFRKFKTLSDSSLFHGIQRLPFPELKILGTLLRNSSLI
jgi:hypothetical protein